MNQFYYKGYYGSADIIDTIPQGKILFIRDLVSYDADVFEDLEIEFQNAVDEYLCTCQLVGKKPDQPLGERNEI